MRTNGTMRERDDALYLIIAASGRLEHYHKQVSRSRLKSSGGAHANMSAAAIFLSAFRCSQCRRYTETAASTSAPSVLREAPSAAIPANPFITAFSTAHIPRLSGHWQGRHRRARDERTDKHDLDKTHYNCYSHTFTNCHNCRPRFLILAKMLVLC